MVGNGVENIPAQNVKTIFEAEEDDLRYNGYSHDIVVDCPICHTALLVKNSWKKGGGDIPMGIEERVIKRSSAANPKRNEFVAFVEGLPYWF